MPVYKASYFFTQRKNGWSETWYWEKANASEALEAAKDPLSRRVNLLGGGGTGDESAPALSAIRVSNVDIQRDSLVYVVPTADGKSNVNLGTAENPNLALLLRIEGGDLYRRNLYLRGYPDSMSGDNGRFVADPHWMGLFNNWKNRMIDRSAGILATSKTAFPPLLITGLALTGVSEVIVTTNPAHGYATGDSVRVISAPGTTGVRGVWRIAVLDATNFRLMGSNSPTAHTSYLGGGRVTKRTSIIVPITTIQTERLTHRITGRPFDSPVGSRARRVRA